MLRWLKGRPDASTDGTTQRGKSAEYGEVEDLLPEQVYHDAARHFLDVQVSTADLLDTRAVQMFSVGSLVIPVTFALLNLGSEQVEISTLARWCLSAAIVLYVAVLFCVIQASTLIRGLEYRPKLSKLREYSEQYAGHTLLRWVANEYEESSLENERVLIRKGRWVGAATLALYSEGALIAAAALLTLLL
jgi:hypothetical protein